MLYKPTCKECGHYLRSAVVNIDLWKTIWSLFETPTSTIKNIIFAEHKNFVSFLLVLLSIKLYLSFTIIHSIFSKSESYFSTSNIFFASSLLLVLAIILVKIITIFFNMPKKGTRYKDNLALTVYSFIPIILALFILTPIEYGIFGVHWYDYNPSPILMKEGTAYILLVIEVIMFLWSIFLLARSYFIQTSSVIRSTISVVLFIFTLLFVLKTLPYNLL